jgi:sn-glycerol 3-phosphate transport system ATP-binding protein
VVLLNQGRIEQNAPPRALYAQPATTFAARFIGTPAMNLLALAGDRIAGSDIAVSRPAAMLGIRPEAVRLGGPVPATVASVEYLGADLVLRCAVGTERITVRAEGRVEVPEGAAVTLGWPSEAEHFFDARGARLS